MAPYEVLYGRRCQSPLCWYEGGDLTILGPQLVDETIEKIKKIRERLLSAQDRQKKYFDTRHRKIEFSVSNLVFLKVSLMKDVVRFGKANKLNPRYIGLFEIIERVRTVAYRLVLSPQLSGIHDVFHVSILRKCISDPSQEIHFEPSDLELRSDLSYKEKLMRILAKDVRRLRNKKFPMIKVLWNNQTE
ncbi:hypothetical protein AXF42_Ash021520 [Apostasia shenzhenica]|uniref:Tf2-1-like SH3-like domain-containing protein n=1 Tax=Apostasia shenzhenica TaxID=1088818 RepID=A0A2H9ZTW7_9ASPA|nr:hypothetical protein AXF42_Ash021520 [Apostasia shenzhenica]